MTSETIDGLPVGNELDELVMRKIFGWKKDIFYLSEDSDFPYYIPSGKPKRTHMLDARPLPRFSRDIPAAWEVVKKMIEHGWLAAINPTSPKFGPILW